MRAILTSLCGVFVNLRAGARLEFSDRLSLNLGVYHPSLIKKGDAGMHGVELGFRWTPFGRGSGE